MNLYPFSPLFCGSQFAIVLWFNPNGLQQKLKFGTWYVLMFRSCSFKVHFVFVSMFIVRLKLPFFCV